MIISGSSPMSLEALERKVFDWEREAISEIKVLSRSELKDEACEKLWKGIVCMTREIACQRPHHPEKSIKNMMSKVRNISIGVEELKEGENGYVDLFFASRNISKVVENCEKEFKNTLNKDTGVRDYAALNLLHKRIKVLMTEMQSLLNRNPLMDVEEKKKIMAAINSEKIKVAMELKRESIFSKLCGWSW